MLKEHSTLFRRISMVADIGIVIVSFFIGYWVRNHHEGLAPITVYLWVLPLLILIWSSLLYMFGMYRSFRTRDAFSSLYIIFYAAFLGLAIFSSILYIFKIESVSRLFIFLTFSTCSFMLTLEKTLGIFFLRHIRRQGRNVRNILLVGTGPRAQKFIRLIQNHPEFGLKIIGLVDREFDIMDREFLGYKMLGTFQDIPDIIKTHVVDEIIFVVPSTWLASLEQIIMFCDTQGVTTRIAVDLFQPKISKIKITSWASYPLLTFESTPDRLFDLVMKRTFDVVLSSVALVVLSPVFLFTALAIKLTSKGPVFYSQKRCGLNGRTFKLFKFRTMVQDADELKKKLLALNEMKGAAFKLTNDPRITKVGKYLRKLSIDELPQFWNVLKGDMSLVGPRPPLPEEVEQYDNWQRRRLRMRPGITCLWQVNGRNRITDFNEWAKLDLEYIDNWSLWLDTRILFKTVPVVLFGVGAK